MAKLGSIPAASTGTIRLTYVPEILVLKATDLSKIDSAKLNIFGVGVVLDLPQKGLKAFDGFGQVGDDSTAYVIPLGNGKFLNTEAELTVVNSQAAATIEVYGFGTRKGTHLISYITEKGLTGNMMSFDKFLGLAMPDIAANDIITAKTNVIDDVTGEKVATFDEILTRDEIKAMSTAFTWQSQYAFYNGNQLYSRVDVVLSADQTMYYSRVIDPSIQ